MKHCLNSGKPQTDNAVGNPERSPEQGNVQRLSREGVEPSGSKQAASRTDEDIVSTLSKDKEVRVCRKCGKPKTISDGFYSNRHVCKVCIIERVSKYQKTPEGREAHHKSNNKWGKTEKGKLSKKKYKHTKKGRESGRKHYYSMMRRIPEKLRARALINTHIRRGKLIRPNICENCGGHTFTDAHHEDYNKPLEVNWLCYNCHVKQELG